MKTFMTSGFFPLTLCGALLLLYHFDHSVFTLFAAGFELGMSIFELIDFFQLRYARTSRRDKLIEVRVNAATFDRLHLMADQCDVSLPVFCSCCLASVDPVELAAADPRKEVTGDA